VGGGRGMDGPDMSSEGTRNLFISTGTPDNNREIHHSTVHAIDILSTIPTVDSK
jgi:hypothetical protein